MSRPTVPLGGRHHEEQAPHCTGAQDSTVEDDQIRSESRPILTVSARNFQPAGRSPLIQNSNAVAQPGIDFSLDSSSQKAILVW